MLFTWGSVLIIGLFSNFFLKILFQEFWALLGAIVFFIVTNFGVWIISGMYALNLKWIIISLHIRFTIFGFSALLLAILRFI